MAIGRREFLAGLGGVGAGLGLGAFSHWLPLASPEFGPDWSPGKESFVASTCLLCPSHCGIRGRILDGKLVRVDGNPLHPVSQGGLCPKGRAGIQLLYHPGRLTGPVERTGPPGSDDFQRISWDQALDRLTKTLTDLRAKGKASSVAWLAGDTPGIMGEVLRRFARLYGTTSFIQEDYRDGSAEVMKLSQGIDSPPAYDLASADMVLSFGAALSEAWWCLPQAARARDADSSRRPRWVQFDVRLSRTASGADEWVPVRPGTYGAMAFGIAYILLKEGLYDVEGIQDQVSGFEDWRDEDGRLIPGFRTLVLRHGRTEDISERTGVPSETLVRIAKAFGAASRPVALWDRSVAWHAGGLADALAIHALNILVGALDRPGGVMIQPPLPLAPLEPAAAAEASEEGPGGSLLPGNWAARLAAGTASPLEALFLYYSNPVASNPNGDEVAKALEAIPLVVSFSPFLDESARYAHLILPDHTYLERWQDAPAPPTVPTPVWGLVQPMVPPLHDTRATGDVVLDLASRLGGEVAAGFPRSTVEDLVQDRGKALASAQRGSVFVPAFQRAELRELEARGWWLPHGLSAGVFWKSIRDSGGWYDPHLDYNDRSAKSQFAGGKTRLLSSEARRKIASATPGEAASFLPLDEEPPSRRAETDFPLRLIPYPVMTLASGGTALMPWLLENLGVLTHDAWETWAEINPETGRELGLRPGQRVRVESLAGSFQVSLRFYEGAQPGAVNVPYGLHTIVEGWGRTEGANPLRAVGNRRDPVTGLPDWYSTRVRVVPA